ncbi:MAG: HD domain-containing protein [Candidatus Woesearchaeota archaeon]
MAFNIPSKNNPVLESIQARVNEDERIQALFEACNVMAIKRLGMSDHGPVHVAIVANIALKLLRNLAKHGIEASIIKDWELTPHDAEVVVVLAALFHDVGNAVHRDIHDVLGPTLARGFIEELLAPHYAPRESQILTTEVMSAMVSHSEDKIRPLTLEGGILRLADALDMEKGRARISFDQGNKDIHSVSAMSIEKVRISEGERPIEIEIIMNTLAGVFQVDYLLKRKLKGSGLEQYVRVRAIVEHSGGSTFLNDYTIE